MKIKQFKEMEKALIKGYEKNEENVVVLADDDFKDGKLTVFGYHRLKQQCDYIPYREDIELVIPKRQEQGFKETLEAMGANELSHLKKERFETRIASVVLLGLGLLLIALGNFVEFFSAKMIHELVIIASWVFVWAAVEKWFFDRRDLTQKRFNLLHILSAKITVKENE